MDRTIATTDWGEGLEITIKLDPEHEPIDWEIVSEQVKSTFVALGFSYETIENNLG